MVLGGLGLGYTMHELLADSRVEKCAVVEIEPALVEWLRAGLVPDGPALLADERVTVVVADIVVALAEAREASYDLVLLDVDNGPGYLVHAANAALYEPPALTDARRVLRPGGALVVWSAGGGARARGRAADGVRRRRGPAARRTPAGAGRALLALRRARLNRARRTRRRPSTSTSYGGRTRSSGAQHQPRPWSPSSPLRAQPLARRSRGSRPCGSPRCEAGLSANAPEVTSSNPRWSRHSTQIACRISVPIPRPWNSLAEPRAGLAGAGDREVAACSRPARRPTAPRRHTPRSSGPPLRCAARPLARQWYCRNCRVQLRTCRVASTGSRTACSRARGSRRAATASTSGKSVSRSGRSTERPAGDPEGERRPESSRTSMRRASPTAAPPPAKGFRWVRSTMADEEFRTEHD